MLFDKIKQWVLTKHKNKNDSYSYISLLNDFNKEWTLFNVLKEVLNSEDLLNDLESRAFYHPLGVLKLPLYYADKNEPELRIHIYDKLIKNDKYEEAHDHKWDMCSYILSGKFKFTQLEISSYGSEFSLVDMRSNGVGSKRDTINSGTVFLDEKFVSLLNRGDQYYFKHGNIHNFIPIGNGINSTLIVRGPYILNSTKLFESTEKGKKRALYVSTVRTNPMNLRDHLLKLKTKIEEDLEK